MLRLLESTHVSVEPPTSGSILKSRMRCFSLSFGVGKMKFHHVGPYLEKILPMTMLLA